MGTPRYPRELGDVLRELRQGVVEAQAAAQNRVAYARSSEGLVLDDLGSHPGNPPAGAVILYAIAGHLWCKEADGSQHQLTS